MFAAIGTSSVLVSSGLLAWQLYQIQSKKQEVEDNNISITCHQEKQLVEHTASNFYGI